MKTFIIKSVLFLLPIFLAALSMEMILRNIPNDFQYKNENFHKNASKIETLIIGNSHSLYGLNPKFIDGYAFNLSQVSQSPDLDQKVVEEFLPKLPNLKTLVIRLSYDSTFEQLKGLNESWRLKNYYLYYGFPNDVAITNRFEISAVSLKHNLKRINDYYIQKIPSLEVDEMGFGKKPSTKVKPDIEKSGLITAKRHTIETDEYFYKNKFIYENLISYCKKRGIKVVSVTLPTYKSYYENLNQRQLDSTLNFGNYLQKKYDNCEYYNFLKDTTFDASHFFDADHLNEKGAKKFSLHLNSLLKH
jgi:RNase H-fold protein (predicted Holliday junction resolvase)